MSSQYFAEQPVAAHRPGTVHVVLPDTHLKLATDSGVFSPERLDPGTRLLLETAPPPPADGDLLDLGSGYGPLALVLARRAPAARVWAVDVNRRALELCERNAADAGLTTVRCRPPDDPGLPATYQLIWSNPPIRIGKDALHELLSSWLSRLAPARSPTWSSSATSARIRSSAGWRPAAGKPTASPRERATASWRCADERR